MTDVTLLPALNHYLFSHQLLFDFYHTPAEEGGSPRGVASRFCAAVTPGFVSADGRGARFESEDVAAVAQPHNEKSRRLAAASALSQIRARYAAKTMSYR